MRTNRKMADDQPNEIHPIHKSSKVGNSFNEIESRKNIYNRMINNEIRSRMLAEDFINPHKNTSHNQ